MTPTTTRWCKDINMWTIDRPINPVGDVEGSCVHRTSFCDTSCYNVKLYKMFKGMAKKDIANEKFWQSLPTNKNDNQDSLKALQQKLFRSRRQTKRARLMSRGEAIKDMSDVFRIKTLCEATPDTVWWVPTRAWRDEGLKQLIQDVLFPLKNISLNASLDPTNTKQEEQMLKDSGWNTMYFGDDKQTTSKVGDRRYLCPKTHKKIKICDTCKGGCFSQVALGKQANVHLSQH